MNSKFILSLSMMSFLFLTGCAPRTVTPSTTGTNSVYDTSTGTVVYSDSNTYGNGTYADTTTVITPTDTYNPTYVEPTTTSNNSNNPYSTYGTTSSGSTNSTYGSSTSPTYGTGAYSYPSGTTYTYPSSSSSSSTPIRTYSDTGRSSSSTQRAYTPARTTSSSSSNYTTASNCKGIHLQVASLATSSLAESYRKSLSLSGSQKSYVKSVDGKNKVIICGISTMNEANSLKSTKFPGSFVVSGSATSSSYSSSSSTYSASSSSKSGVAVQIGAFSSKAAASAAIAPYNGKYTSQIKEIKSNGKTLYKAIIKGFKNEAEALNAISSGKVTGFIVH